MTAEESTAAAPEGDSLDYDTARWAFREIVRLRAALTFIAGEGCRGPGLIENLSCADTLRPEDGEQYCHPCVAREALTAPSGQEQR